MDKITVGIISSNRKLRFAYRVLLTEESDQQIEVLFDGLSLHELGTNQPGNTSPEFLLIDEDIVGTNKKLFYHFLQELFPHSAIMLMDKALNHQSLRKTISIILTHRNYVA